MSSISANSRLRRLAAAALAALVLLPASLGAQAPEPRAHRYDPARVEFVIGNIEFVLLHELAHVLIEDLELPIIGAEESAADYIATAALLRADRFDMNQVQRAQEFLLATANGLATQWDVGLRAGKEIQFWDAHLLTIQRFFDLICLVHGSDPETFDGLPERVGMPPARAARCEEEYERAERSLIWLLDNYGRGPDDALSAEIELVFESAPTRVSSDLAERIEASGVVQGTLERMRERFPIDEPFRVAFRSCGAPQALWLAEAREVAICYELVDNYFLLGADSGVTYRRGLLGSAPSGPATGEDPWPAAVQPVPR